MITFIVVSTCIAMPLGICSVVRGGSRARR